EGVRRRTLSRASPVRGEPHGSRPERGEGGGAGGGGSRPRSSRRPVQPPPRTVHAAAAGMIADLIVSVFNRNQPQVKRCAWKEESRGRGRAWRWGALRWWDVRWGRNRAGGEGEQPHAEDVSAASAPSTP